MEPSAAVLGQHQEFKRAKTLPSQEDPGPQHGLQPHVGPDGGADPPADRRAVRHQQPEEFGGRRQQEDNEVVQG